MCLYPKLIKNRKYTKNKKNGGIIPPINDLRTDQVPVGCGNCMECRKQKARSWQVRLLEDIKQNTNGKFITLTFSNEAIKEICDTLRPGLEGYELDNEIATRGTRLFLERWRKEHGKSLRHWLVTEIGGNGTENIHLHGIVWTNAKLEEVEAMWKYGFVWKGKKVRGKLENYVNEATVNYVVKYMYKRDEKHKEYKSKVLTSPGIGACYLQSENVRKNAYIEGKKVMDTYRTRSGHRIAMPTYWRQKIYNDEQREKLWLQKLDEEKRYINGLKVDISKGEEDYYNILESARELNKQLGFGNDQKDWSRAEYETQRRNLKIKERMKDLDQ